MTDVTLVVRGSSVLVDGVLQPAVVSVAGERIAAVETGADAAVSTAVPSGVEVIDVADGTHVLPGNVDSHVHVNEPGRTKWEGFATATQAAARGGITTIVDMPLNSIPPTTTLSSLYYKRSVASHRIQVDVGFWGGAVPDNLADLEPLWDAGVFGFKCFLADSGVAEFPPLSTPEFRLAMREIGRFGGRMIVHAEDPAVLAAAPAPPSRRYRDFLASRPDESEVSAIRTVIEATREYGTRAHILHLSSAKALGLIADARAEGLPLSVETCPHYLVFDVDHLPDGASEFKCCPPIRDQGNQDALWEGLRDGLIDCIVSDHSPSTVEEKRRGGGDLQLAWGGISGLQVSFPTVVDAAAQRGFGIERVSAWMSAGPAAVAGLATKGAIAVGHDADLVRYVAGRSVTVDGELLSHRAKLTAYNGRVLSGSVSGSMVRGQVVFDGERVSEGLGRRLGRPSTVSASG